MKSFKDLIKEVHEKGVCQQCGGCVSFCNSIEHEVIGFKDPYSPPTNLNKDKCLKCGLCYLICPQTHVLEDEINTIFKFSDFSLVPLGFYYNIRSCQAVDREFFNYGTDGGVVNAIINFLFEKELIDGAIVAKTLAPFSREATIAKSKEDLLDASGIKLDVSSQLEEIQKFHTYVNSLPKLKQFREKKLAIVGTPCQIYTIRCMQNLGVIPSDNVDLCLGLFCYENFFFDKSQIEKFERDFSVKFDDIEKINIKEDLIVHLNESGSRKKTLHIPFSKLKDYARPACSACADFTNIYADISFGGLGSPEKFTTVLPRTEKGRSIILKAIKAQVIKCTQLKTSEKEDMKRKIAQYSIAKAKRPTNLRQKEE
ncbi:MAG: Coenzyme F420 hydrogenase/dehydrogenase, beta subunit C-terminal domain [Candidatus Hermodarchaeota archaeon]